MPIVAIPPMRAARFEQLEAGELFIYLEYGKRSYALKTLPHAAVGQAGLVLLGPSFIDNLTESFLVSWQPATVLSLGRNFAVLPGLDPASWSTTGPSRVPVCLAVAGSDMYVCTNGASSPRHYQPFYVDIRSGAVLTSPLPSMTAYTNSWEIITVCESHPPRSVLRYPLLQ